MATCGGVNSFETFFRIRNLLSPLVVVVIRPLLKDGGIAKDHGAPGNSLWSGPEVVERQRVTEERAARRVRSWTAQNEMTGVLGRVSILER